MSEKTKHRWTKMAPRINVDAFEEAIEFDPIETDEKGNDRGHCILPYGLHSNGDTTGKFAIHREKRVYGCWVCGGGSLLSLAMELKGLDEDDALDWLEQFTGPSTASDDDFESELEMLMAQEERLEAVMPYFNPRMVEPYQVDHPWFAERGISDEVRVKYKLGFNPDATRRSKKDELYTGPGIILPHYWNDRLVGWQTRWLDDDRPAWLKKYINTSGFPKESTIFNYERVYFESPIVVCESVVTALFLTSIGIAAIATFGASVTKEQMRLLRRCQQGLILAPDNDGGGRKMVISVTESVRRFIPSLRVTSFVGPEGGKQDLGDLSDDPYRVREIVEGAEYTDDQEWIQDGIEKIHKGRGGRSSVSRRT